jgi:manganese/iron transport system permease protein/iron/zinc/copper transport system permease protein
LEQAGAPEKEWHPKAHVLEHVSDRATIDYLDDKLGHPILDPHGSEIPAGPRDAGELLLSHLREGDQAQVLKIRPAAQAVGLRIGQFFTIGPRSADGKSWSIRTEHQEFNLSHDQADAVIVSLDRVPTRRT